MAFVAGVISALQALAFVVVWHFNRRTPGIGSWALAALLNGLALALLPARSWIDSPLLTRVLPTTMNFTAAALFYMGAAAFSGRFPRLRWPLIAAFPVYLGYLWVTLVRDEPRLRLLFTSPIFLLFINLGAFELFRERRPGLRFSTRLIGTVASLFSLLFLHRMIALPLQSDVAGLLDPAGPQQALFGVLILFGLFWTFGLMMLINQRQLLEIRQASEEALQAKEETSALEKEILAERALRQRQMLVRDLHDGLGGITAHLALLTSRPTGNVASPSGEGNLRDIQQLAQEGNRELRLLMNTLERGLTHWGDFLTETRTHAEKVCVAHGVTLDWVVSGQLPSEPSQDVPAMLSLLRALKEALNNAARHGKASRIACRLAFRSGTLGISVRDDGCGFSRVDRPGRGRGLGNMSRRLEELGGRARIESRLGLGTLIRFVVPLPVSLQAGGEVRSQPTHDPTLPPRG